MIERDPRKKKKMTEREHNNNKQIKLMFFDMDG
jgi:hypothetical protein